jgi:outer membrane protein, heavy metal efflux system
VHWSALRVLAWCFSTLPLPLIGPSLRAGEPFTLERALALAEQNNPQLRVASAQIEGAQAGILTARAYPNPEAGLQGGQQHARIPGGLPGPNLIYGFSQPLETPGVRQSRIRVAEIGRESSAFVLDETRILVRAAVKQSFYQVLRRKAEIGLALENLKLIEDLRRRIQVQVEVGEAARLELTRAEAEVATARTYARSAELRLVTAISSLRAAVSVPLPADIEPRGELDPPALLPGLEQLREEVLERYPALAQARVEIRRAQARVNSEMSLRIPQPVIRGEYEQAPDIGTYRLGISIPVPLWNKRKGPIAEAEAFLRQMTANTEARRIEITAAVESAYGRYEVAGQQIVAFQEGVLKQAAAALQAAEAAFKFGERGIIEVLDAQRVLRAARLDFMNAQFDRQAALIDIQLLRAEELKGPRP